MRFVTAKHQNEEFIGVVNINGTRVLPIQAVEKERSGKTLPNTLIECITLGERFIDLVKGLLDWVEGSGRRDEFFLPLEQITLLAPIPRPNKNIFCVGKNYADHAIELGSAEDIPKHVMVFTKAPTTVIGPEQQVLNHQGLTEQLDYEGELAVIIGKTGRAIKQEDALDYVFGYTILNDVTARDLQARHKQFFIGKSLDTTCPIGPWIVHKSEIADPDQLKIETRINGEVRQSSTTENCIFPIEEIIAVLSAGMTLEPGDIIATGTPAGVGKGFNPPKFLKSGDQMEVLIEKIGVLRNTIA